MKLLRNVGKDIYVGGRFSTGNSFITLKPSSDKIPPIPPDIGLHTNLRALGMEVSRDSRPNRFYPLKGSVIDFTGDFFMKGLGSKYSFQSYKFTFNKYMSLSDKQYLLTTCTSAAPVARHLFMAIAFTAPIMSCAVTQRVAI